MSVHDSGGVVDNAVWSHNGLKPPPHNRDHALVCTCASCVQRRASYALVTGAPLARNPWPPAYGRES